MNPYDLIYNEKLDSLLKDVMFPQNRISTLFHKDLKHALQFYTADMLGISIEEYGRLYEYANSATMVTPMPIAFVGFKAIKGLAPSQWTNCDNEDKISHYLLTTLLYNKHEEVWNEIAAPYMEQARKFAEDKAKRDQREMQAKGRILQLNGKAAIKQS